MAIGITVSIVLNVLLSVIFFLMGIAACIGGLIVISFFLEGPGELAEPKKRMLATIIAMVIYGLAVIILVLNFADMLIRMINLIPPPFTITTNPLIAYCSFIIGAFLLPAAVK
jgi:hypothetical protein